MASKVTMSPTFHILQNSLPFLQMISIHWLKNYRVKEINKKAMWKSRLYLGHAYLYQAENMIIGLLHLADRKNDGVPAEDRGIVRKNIAVCRTDLSEN